MVRSLGLGLENKMNPHYRKHGKIQVPLSDEEFKQGMQPGHFIQRKHKGFIALLFYTGVRKSEALRVKKEQFQLRSNQIIFDVGRRLKHGLETPPLNIPLDAAYAQEISWAVENTRNKKRVWPYCKKTGYNIVDRVFKYPHYFRLSRITNFFLEGWTIAQVRSWTGLTLKALESYVGLVDVMKMGDSLAKTKSS